jgi:hypothetical protein
MKGYPLGRVSSRLTTSGSKTPSTRRDVERASRCGGGSAVQCAALSTQRGTCLGTRYRSYKLTI